MLLCPCGIETSKLGSEKGELMPEQLVLPFITEMDRHAEDERETEACRMRRANAIAILRSTVQVQPLPPQLILL